MERMYCVIMHNSLLFSLKYLGGNCFQESEYVLRML